DLEFWICGGCGTWVVRTKISPAIRAGRARGCRRVHQRRQGGKRETDSSLVCFHLPTDKAERFQFSSLAFFPQWTDNRGGLRARTSSIGNQSRLKFCGPRINHSLLKMAQGGRAGPRGGSKGRGGFKGKGKRRGTQQPRSARFDDRRL